MSVVRTWATGLAHRSAEEVLHTAWPVLEDLVLHGATAVRSHVNLNEANGVGAARRARRTSGRRGA